jgi:hypothetical protein
LELPPTRAVPRAAREDRAEALQAAWRAKTAQRKVDAAQEIATQAGRVDLERRVARNAKAREQVRKVVRVVLYSWSGTKGAGEAFAAGAGAASAGKVAKYARFVREVAASEAGEGGLLTALSRYLHATSDTLDAGVEHDTRRVAWYTDIVMLLGHGVEWATARKVGVRVSVGGAIWAPAPRAAAKFALGVLYAMHAGGVRVRAPIGEGDRAVAIVVLDADPYVRAALAPQANLAALTAGMCVPLTGKGATQGMNQVYAGVASLEAIAVAGGTEDADDSATARSLLAVMNRAGRWYSAESMRDNARGARRFELSTDPRGRLV